MTMRASPHLNPLPGGEEIPGTGNVLRTTGPLASPLVTKSTPATKEDLRSFFDHLERELDAVDFWKVADKKPKMWLNLRNVFARGDLTEQEVRSLHGVVAALREGTRHE